MLRDEMGIIFANELFADLVVKVGRAGIPAWRLTLVTVMQYMENLTDRQAAEAVRARMD